MSCVRVSIFWLHRISSKAVSISFPIYRTFPLRDWVYFPITGCLFPDYKTFPVREWVYFLITAAGHLLSGSESISWLQDISSLGVSVFPDYKTFPLKKWACFLITGHFLSEHESFPNYRTFVVREWVFFLITGHFLSQSESISWLQERSCMEVIIFPG